jgi:hypothetical protein
MKRKIIIILCVLMVCIGIATRSSAGETYDLNGEWDTVFDHGPFGVFKDIVKISQQGNTFVGTTLIGSTIISKGEKTIKGELIDKMISQVHTYNHKGDSSGERFWGNAQGVIIEEGNKIVIQSYSPYSFVKTLSMTRKQ